MNLVKTLAAGVVALSAMTTASLAADVIYPIVPAPAPIVVPPVVAQPTWTGAYFGTFGAFTFVPFDSPNYKNLGVIGGYDFQIGSRFVAGVNVRTSIPSPVGVGAPLFIGAIDANANSRAGVLIGGGQRLLAYGTAGIGYTAGPGVAYMTVGGGAEFALTDRVHMFSEFTHARALGGGGPIGNSIQFGVTLR
ncbi:MAG: hypothetical protein KIS68_00865 [Bauldia sp.]|nr:hypothetical protein [Bauldia sp.]